VRDQLRSYDEEPGWYQHPPGTVALKATDEELRGDGIDVSKIGPDADSRRSPATKGNGHAGH